MAKDYEQALRNLIESCISQKFLSSDSLMIPAEMILEKHPDVAPIMVDYFRSLPDDKDIKEFLGTLIVFYDRTPHKDVFDYVAKFDPMILQDVQWDEQLVHYKEAFFK